MILLHKGVSDALVMLQCPHCSHHQQRAKKPRQTDVYACQRCHRRFTLAEGKRAAAAAKARR